MCCIKWGNDRRDVSWGQNPAQLFVSCFILDIFKHTQVGRTIQLISMCHPASYNDHQLIVALVKASSRFPLAPSMLNGLAGKSQMVAMALAPALELPKAPSTLAWHGHRGLQRYASRGRGHGWKVVKRGKRKLLGDFSLYHRKHRLELG